MRTLDDIRALLNAGADKVSINTTAVQQPGFVREGAQRFGAPSASSAIDAKRRKPADSGRSIRMVGGRRLDWMRWSGPSAWKAMGWGILLTSMDPGRSAEWLRLGADGCRVARLSIPVIASGGGYPRAFMMGLVQERLVMRCTAASIFHWHRTHTDSSKEDLFA